MLPSLILATFSFVGTAVFTTLLRQIVTEMNYVNLNKWLQHHHKSKTAVTDSVPERPITGEVLPKPQNETTLDIYFTLILSKLDIKVTNNQCSTLMTALFKLTGRLASLKRLKAKHRGRSRRSGGRTKESHLHGGFIKELLVNLTQPCEMYPHLYMDEKYELNVSAITTLKSGSLWGILRGLETLAQLFRCNENYSEIRIHACSIIDFPSYPHRGLLLDTARNYISVDNILTILDFMAMNKMNVFHWYIVDDISFPYQSLKFPELSGKGALYPNRIYTPESISVIVEYARVRGIRVIPEFTMPGHTNSLMKSHPEILTKCYDKSNPLKTPGVGPLHPLKKITYMLLGELLREMQNLFPDEYFHIGGEQPNLQCWLSNRRIRKFMVANNMTDITQVFALFFKRVTSLFKNGTVPIVSQIYIESQVPIPKKTIVQVWKRWTIDVVEILKRNRRVIVTSPWHMYSGRRTFLRMFVAPRERVRALLSHKQLNNLLGGEACLCSDMVVNQNAASGIWPRASAVAELLWNPVSNKRPEDSLRRAEEHVCRMRSQGILSEPLLGTGSCDPVH